MDHPGPQLEGDDPDDLPALRQDLGHKPLVEPLDRLVLEGGLEEGVEHVEADLVRGERRSLHAHTAERPHGDATVRLTAPGASPVLHLDDLGGGPPHEELDGVLVR